MRKREEERGSTAFVGRCADEGGFAGAWRAVEENRGAELATADEEGGGEQGGEQTALVERTLRVFLADDVLPGEGVCWKGASFGRDCWM